MLVTAQGVRLFSAAGSEAGTGRNASEPQVHASLLRLRTAAHRAHPGQIIGVYRLGLMVKLEHG